MALVTTGKSNLVGFSELAALLNSLPEEVGPQKLLKRSLMNAAAIIESDAKARCPVDTGRLRECISRGFGKASLEPGLTDQYAAVVLVGTIDGGTKAGARKLEAIGLTKDAYYAHFTEFGTRHSRAEPFLRPAFDEQADATISALGDELGYAIDQVWTSGASNLPAVD